MGDGEIGATSFVFSFSSRKVDLACWTKADKALLFLLPLSIGPTVECISTAAGYISRRQQQYRIGAPLSPEIVYEGKSSTQKFVFLFF